MAIRVDLLLAKEKANDKADGLGGRYEEKTKKKRSHGGQQGQHRRRNEKVRRPKGYAPPRS